MSIWALIRNGRVDTTVEQDDAPEVDGYTARDITGQAVGTGHTTSDGGLTFAAPEEPTTWLLDIGPFFNRFGAAKTPALQSSDATVRAFVTEVMASKWVDLASRRDDIIAACDYMIAIGIAGMTTTLRDNIVNKPAKQIENIALRKQFFN